MTSSAAIAVPQTKRPTEFTLGDAEFRMISATLQAEAGIVLSDQKRDLVRSRLSRRVRALGCESFEEYCRFVKSDDGIAERRELIEALTTNVTNFFREGHHFDTLAKKIVPVLKQKAQRGERIRIWSAGCSEGMEPYSIAMTLLDAFPDIARCDAKILATDIDRQILAKAARGAYASYQIDKVPGEILRRHFTAEGDMQVVKPAVRDLVSFRPLNLIAPWPVKGPFDVIFCRNVVIYFDNPTKERLWEQFASKLGPGGYLFIGHSERVTGNGMAKFVSEGMTAYRRAA